MSPRISILAAAAALVPAACAGSDDPGPEGGKARGAPAQGVGASDGIVRNDRRPPPFDAREWPRTDFSIHKGPLSEFEAGDVPRDGIPPIDRARIASQRDRRLRLAPREPVLVAEAGGEARGYPLRIMLWHEIVNDRLGGRPIAVTYCPLCNSGVVFDPRLGGRTLTFGNTGAIRRSDLVMYDRQTESWWQQLTAEAVVGRLTGERLRVLPSQILSWGEFRRLHPGGTVLMPPRNVDRPYGRSPYLQYDDLRNPLTRLRERPDPALPAKERVASIQTARGAIVYPFSRLRRESPVNDVIGGRPVTVFFSGAAGSVLDTPDLRRSRRRGASAVFGRRLNGRVLSFTRTGPGRFRDRQTGSTWDMVGRAVSGPLEGRRLERVAHDDHFWFAIAAFYERPDIRR